MKPEDIRKLRKRLGLTQTQFAKRVGVSFATVNRWEKGKNEPLPDRMAELKRMNLVGRMSKTSRGYTFSRADRKVRVTKVDDQGFRVVMLFTRKDLHAMLEALA